MDFAGQSSPYLLSGWGYGHLSGEDLVSSVVPPLFTFQGDGISGGCRTPRLVEDAVRVPALVALEYRWRQREWILKDVGQSYGPS